MLLAAFAPDSASHKSGAHAADIPSSTARSSRNESALAPRVKSASTIK